MPKVGKGEESGVKLRGTTGLPDNIVAYIDTVTFGVDSSYASGKEVVAILEFVDADGNPVSTGGDKDGRTNNTVFASVGKGWDDADKGRALVKADGSEPTGINDQTMYQTIINAALDTDAAPIIEARFAEGVMPFHAGLIEKLGFLWKRHEYTPFNFQAEEGKSKPSRLLPAEFVGELGGDAASGGGEKKAKKDKKKKDKGGPATDD